MATSTGNMVNRIKDQFDKNGMPIKSLIIFSKEVEFENGQDGQVWKGRAHGLGCQ
jgi:hypothetical protein